jgi:acyl-CoA synthetase (AMP-forming)/AMP-acid ligase II
MNQPTVKLLDRLARHAMESPRRIAVREIAGGRTITYAALRDAAEAFAAELRRAAPAPTVAMLKMHNTCDFSVAFLAALAAGHTIFPVSPEITDHEFTVAAARAGAGACISEDLRIAPFAPDAHGGPAALNGPPPARSMLLQSSGTTGLPKIVRRGADSLDAVARNCAEAVGFTAEDQVLQCVPLCHSYGVEHGLLAPLFAGSTVHLAAGFDLNIVRRELTAARITLFPAVPSIYEMLANLPGNAGCFTHLRIAYSAGGPLPPTVFQRLRDDCGLTVGQLYGATEIGSITFSNPGAGDFVPASVGKVMNGVLTRIDSGGQLLVRAPSMMSGYLGESVAFSEDGFFPTGDLARFDEQHNLFITGRQKLLIDVGGLKVNPLEVEAALCQHPGVGQCIVVPVILSETIARLKAVIIPVDRANPPAAEDLRRFARQRLTAHKVPRIFEIRSALPASPTGKILRHQVESA